MQYHRVVGVNNSASWVGLGVDFRKPSMEVILSYGVPRTMNKNWDSTF